MSHHILYVDDDADIRSIVEFAFDDEADFSLHLCASGAEALTAIAANPPDLVLLDVMMPGMDGPSTLRQIQTLANPPPVIFITAKVQLHEVNQLLNLGACAVIAKPFDPMQLPAQVRAVLQP